jgi:hypothetical protein
MTKLLNKLLGRLVQTDPENLKRFTNLSFEDFLGLCDNVKSHITEQFKEFNLDEDLSENILSAIITDILLDESGIEDVVLEYLESFIKHLKELLYSSNSENLAELNQKTTAYKEQVQFTLDLLFNYVLNLKVAAHEGQAG